jgi:hypothetical protein
VKARAFLLQWFDLAVTTFMLHAACSTMYEWQQCESCAAALRGSAKGRNGPFMSIDTKGGLPTFAAIRTNGSYAQIVYFAKLRLRPLAAMHC